MTALRPSDRLPNLAVPALIAGHGRAAIVTRDGEILLFAAEQAAGVLRGLPPPLVVHAPATWRRLGLRGQPRLDLLELFAFVIPARPGRRHAGSPSCSTWTRRLPA